MKVSDKIIKLRAEKELTQQDIAKIAGVSDRAVSSWENGTRSPKLGPIKKICEHFGIDLTSFIDDSCDDYDVVPHSVALPPNMYPARWREPVPLVGDIACGTPILAEQNITDYVQTPEHIHADFALRCQGESMKDAGVHTGDIVFIRQQPEVINGQIAAVLVDGAESGATLKRVYLHGDVLTLQAANPKVDPQIFIGADIERVHIIGLAVGFVHVFEQ